MFKKKKARVNKQMKAGNETEHDSMNVTDNISDVTLKNRVCSKAEPQPKKKFRGT